MYINNLKSAFVKTETNIFSSKALQSSIIDSNVVEYFPVSVGTSEVIEFFIPESPAYLDLARIKLYIKAKIIDSTGVIVKNEYDTTDATLRKGVHVSPCNNFQDSLFSKISIFLNHKSITSPGSHQYYRAYLEKLINFGSDSKSSHLASALYIEDEYNKMDDFDNKGSIERMKRIKQGSIELLGYLHTDLTSLDKLLLNNVNVRFKLQRNQTSFSLMTHKKSTLDYKIEITDAILLVRKVTLNPSVIYANELRLMKENARYCIERVEIKSFTLAKGTNSRSLDNCFLSQLPKRILMFQVAESSMFSYERNPYFFKNFNLTLAALSGDNFTHIRPIKLNFDREEYMEGFSSFNDAINNYFHDHGNCITPEHWKTSAFVLSWDLTPDGSASSSHISLPKSGVLRLDLHYEKPLEENIIVFLYAEMENYINIDAQRQIYTDFAA